MQKLVFRNPNGEEIDFTSGDFGVTKWEGFSHVDMDVQSQQVPFNDGSVFLDALLSERELNVTVAINDDGDLEKRYRLKRELIHCLNPKLGGGELIYTNDYTSKKIVCVPAIPEFENKNINDKGTQKASCTFNASNPYWEDVEEKKIYFNTMKQVIIRNDGDVPCGIDANIYGYGAENPSIVNVTTNQKIKYQDTLNQELNIKTLPGNKTCQLGNFSSQIIKGGDFKSIASGSNEVVVCGSILKTSIDGEKWETESYSDLQGFLSKVKYIKSKKIYLGVGTNFDVTEHFIALSHDGKKWSKIFSSPTIIFNDVDYSEHFDLFITVTSNDKLYTSSDLDSWTEISLNGSFKSIASNDNYIVIAGNQKIAYTSDGQNWQFSSTSITSNLYSIVKGEGNYFITVGTNGSIYWGDNPISWDFKTSGVSTLLSDVYYDSIKSNYYIVGADGKILFLENLSSSVTILSYEYTDNLNSIIYSELCGVFYIVGENGIILYSNDGQEWNIIERSEGYMTIVIDEGRNIYVGVKNNSLIASSNDGFNWEIKIQDTGVPYFIKEKNIFFVLAYGKIYSSPDGETWNEINLNLSENLLNIVYSKEKNLFVCCGASGSILTSTDGEIWTPRTSGVATRLVGLTCNENLFVCSGSNGVILTSPDGETWTSISTGISFNFTNATYISEMNIFVIIYGNKLLVSNDGNTWTSCGPGSMNNITKMIYNPVIKKLCIYVSDDGRIFASSDGYTWNPPINPDGTFVGGLDDLDYSPEMKLFCAVMSSFLSISYDGLHWSNQNQEIFTTLTDIKWIKNKNYFYIRGLNGEYGTTNFKINKNVIDKIAEDSDMALSLKVGDNIIRLLSDNRLGTIELTYKQKYLGV